MKKRYMMPTIRAVEMESGPLLEPVSEEEIQVPIDPNTPKDPGSAMSRDNRGFLLWDEE